MTIAIARRVKYASLALIALSSAGGLQTAFAEGTDAGTDIANRATVNYSVGGAAQTQINSSPTGNSTPGVAGGADTVFEVDRKILHTVAESGGAATITTPGASNVLATFTVTNTGNGAQGYQLTATNLTGGALFGQTDNTDVTVVGAFHDTNGNGAYEAGADTPYINTLAEDGTATVLVVANVPVTTSNGQYANVQLAAAAAVAGTLGATLETPSGSDDPAVVDVVFADAGATPRNGIHEAADQYAIQSAALTVTKLSQAVNDPINGNSNAMAIPGATIRYTITVANASTTTAADAVVLTDVVNAITPYVPGSMTLNGAARTDSNADADGASYDAGTRTISVNVGTIATSGSATVTFDVTIPATP